MSSSRTFIVVFRSRQVELELEDFSTGIRFIRSNQCDVSSWQRRLQQHLLQSLQQQHLPKRFRLRKLLLLHHSDSIVSCNLLNIASVKLTATLLSIAMNSLPSSATVQHLKCGAAANPSSSSEAAKSSWKWKIFSIGSRFTRSNQCDVSSGQRRLQQQLPQHNLHNDSTCRSGSDSES
ncbi:unnamed protein product [Caenorhabditis angaria]|uniref:Uncharacterized protein n=1 Tax=Caenorhabditis angaria TaxID=860376 RepID=A0A9P1IPU1_9PELO|nr:unnamed protein product [Caenorhabditis angaria]